MPHNDLRNNGEKIIRTGKTRKVMINNKGKTPVELVREAMPFFGGTTPVTTVPAATTPAAPDPAATPDPATTPDPAQTPPAGGDDALTKLAQDPNALGQLLSQVEKLQKDLKDAQGKVGEYESKAQEEARKQQTREQQLEADLQQRDATIQQMDAVIRNMAVTNSMLSIKDVKWNSVKQAIAELQDDEFEIDVDLQKGTATVNGIESAAQRIAKDSPWLVAQAGNEPSTSTTTTRTPAKPRSTGTPPAPPTTDGNKAAKRKNLMSRFPAIVR